MERYNSEFIPSGGRKFSRYLTANLVLDENFLDEQAFYNFEF